MKECVLAWEWTMCEQLTTCSALRFTPHTHSQTHTKMPKLSLWRVSTFEKMIAGVRHHHVWPSPWRSIWSRHAKQAIKNVFVTLSPGVKMKMTTVIIFSSLRFQFSQEKIITSLSWICGSSLRTLSGSFLPQIVSGVTRDGSGLSLVLVDPWEPLQHLYVWSLGQFFKPQGLVCLLMLRELL